MPNPMPKRPVPFAPPSITQVERDAVAKALSESRLSQGPYVEEFEADLSQYSGLPYVVACASGTAALHLAMLSLGVGPDDVVIVPELTYVASANAALYVGAQLAFADVEPDHWQSSVHMVRSAILQLPRPVNGRIVVVVVDLYGADNYETACWALSEGYTVVYDAAHSMLAPPTGMASFIRANAERFAMIYSFFPSKHITTGEGGAVLLAHRDLDTRARLYRGQGAPYPRQYFHSVLGYNYRMTDFAAALGIAQLSRVNDLKFMRKAVVDGYRAGFSHNANIVSQEKTGGMWSPWVAAIKLADDPRLPAPGDVILRLRCEFSIDARPVFDVMSSLQHIAKVRLRPLNETTEPWTAHATEARSISARGILLPTYADMSADDVAYVVESLNTIVNPI